MKFRIISGTGYLSSRRISPGLRRRAPAYFQAREPCLVTPAHQFAGFNANALSAGTFIDQKSFSSLASITARAPGRMESDHVMIGRQWIGTLNGQHRGQVEDLGPDPVLAMAGIPPGLDTGNRASRIVRFLIGERH